MTFAYINNAFLKQFLRVTEILMRIFTHRLFLNWLELDPVDLVGLFMKQFFFSNSKFNIINFHKKVLLFKA